MKVIVIGGYPGSGKSTIVRGVLKELEKGGDRFQSFKEGIVSYMESTAGWIVLGDYKDGEKFPGTDRLPMNVQPEAQKLLLQFKKQNPDRVILFEGDRLFNEKMLSFLGENGFDVVLCVVQVGARQLNERRDARSKQDATWRKGRQTKVDNITMLHPVHHLLPNDTKEEQLLSIRELVDEVKGDWKAQVKPASSIKDFWK